MQGEYCKECSGFLHKFHLSQTTTAHLQTLTDPNLIQSYRLVCSTLPEIWHIGWRLVDFLLSKDLVIFFHWIVIFFYRGQMFEGNSRTCLWLINEQRCVFHSFSAATTSCIYSPLHTKLPCQACQRDFITVKVWCYCFSFPYAYCCSFSRHFLVLVINDNTVPPFRESELAVCSLFFLPAALLMLLVEGNVLKAAVPPCEASWNEVFLISIPDSNAYPSNSVLDPNTTRKLWEAVLLFDF